MKVIIGLGNPDLKYQNTFHNLGFMSLDKTASLLGASFSKEKFRSLIAETVVNGEKVLLVKPLTYMNLSGEAVREIVTFYKLDLSDIIVIYDDFDLKAGELRIRENGSAGTHNGMRNIIALLGSEKFARIRVGFKPAGEIKIPLIDLVLSGIKAEDKPLFEETLSLAGNAGADFAKGVSVQEIMRKYNRKN
jgi:PTH1 family peptidyl-tRNA hydrolase